MGAVADSLPSRPGLVQAELGHHWVVLLHSVVSPLSPQSDQVGDQHPLRLLNLSLPTANPNQSLSNQNFSTHQSHFSVIPLLVHLPSTEWVWEITSRWPG